ncbi:MAG TPA: class I SAM-dependent methyltransferase [Methylomirabilota bacterium]|nr:class I SAM-dependent methyltransferase [Methylomirabilota bacterium]
MARRALFAALDGVRTALEHASRLPHHAAVGLVRRADLERGREAAWRRFAELQAADATFTLMAWEEEFYGRFLERGDRILVAGCGTGRDLLGLLERGYSAEGLDVVAACVEAAQLNLKRRGYRTPLHVGAIETAELTGVFDAVIFSWYCYSYIPGRRARVETLRRMRSHLAEGGRVLICYIRRSEPWGAIGPRVARATSWLSRSDWRPEPGDVVAFEQGIASARYEHAFLAEEIEAEARDAGLAVASHDRREEGLLVLTSAAAPARIP